MKPSSGDSSLLEKERKKTSGCSEARKGRRFHWVLSPRGEGVADKETLEEVRNFMKIEAKYMDRAGAERIGEGKKRRRKKETHGQNWSCERETRGDQARTHSRGI